jgi:hypothetical protein
MARRICCSPGKAEGCTRECVRISIAHSEGPVASRGELEFLPDVVGDAGDFDLVLPPPSIDAPALAFDTALAGIASRYGRKTAHAVAIDFEYPGFTP